MILSLNKQETLQIITSVGGVNGNLLGIASN